MLAVGSVGAGVVAYRVRRWVEYLGVSDSQVVPRSRHTCGVWESTRIATATTLLAWIAFLGVGAFPEGFQPLILAISLTAPIACSAAADRWCDADPLWRRIPVWTGLVALYDLYALGAAMGMPQFRLGRWWPVATAFSLFAANAVLGPLYGKVQFRRLQRLVNEDPPREGKGDE
jgi:hypothetical protein